jgi:hypothetical protein
VITKEAKAMKVGRAKLINRPTITKGKTYDKYFLYISTFVVRDKDFPFKVGEELVVRIENGKLIIERA